MYLDAVVTKSFASGALSPAINPAFPSIPIGSFSPLVGARPFRRPTNSGSLTVTYSKGRAQVAVAGYFFGKSDDSTFLSDANFGNSHAAAEPGSGRGVSEVRPQRVVPDSSAASLVRHRREPVRSDVTTPRSDSRRCRAAARTGVTITARRTLALRPMTSHIARVGAGVLCLVRHRGRRRGRRCAATANLTTGCVDRFDPVGGLLSGQGDDRGRRHLQRRLPQVVQGRHGEGGVRRRAGRALRARAVRRAAAGAARRARRRADRDGADHVAVRVLDHASVAARRSRPPRRADGRGAARCR